MNEYIVKNGKKLRLGYTTGTCAAAAAKAAAHMLLTGEPISAVQIQLPVGQTLTLPLKHCKHSPEFASCSVVKDGGDDPDATHGMEIYAKLTKTPFGLDLQGGKGIGRVTKPGLPCPVGAAAINPVPRQMILAAVEGVVKKAAYSGGLHIEIYAPQGEAVTEKTFNARLGILGGISILGTTGLVEPMSEAAIIETIRLEIATKNPAHILLLSPGNYGMDFAAQTLGLNIDHGVKCSNYIGEALDFARYKGVKEVLLVGHVGKLAKLAAGVMNTHSKMADCRNEIFVAHAALAGADKAVLQSLMVAATTDQMHAVLVQAGMEKAVYDRILAKILFHLSYRLGEGIQPQAVVFSKENGLLMESAGARDYIARTKEQERER